PPLLEAARPVYQLFAKAENLHEHINYQPGTHNFEREHRETLSQVIGKHLIQDSPSYSPLEIDSEADVQTAEELNVELPEGNLDLQKLAQQVMEKLPRPTPNRAALATTLRLPGSAGKVDPGKPE